MRLSREQMKTLAQIEPRLVQPSDGAESCETFEIEQDADLNIRVRDIERDFWIAVDGTQPWG